MIDIPKIATDISSWIAVTIVGGVVGWIVTLYRKVNTNEAQLKQDRIAHATQINSIMTELHGREKQRDEDRERMGRVEDDIRESRRDIQDIKNALIVKG